MRIRSEEEKRALLEEAKTIGMKACAKKHKIDVSSLYVWRRKLGIKGKFNRSKNASIKQMDFMGNPAPEYPGMEENRNNYALVRKLKKENDALKELLKEAWGN